MRTSSRHFLIVSMLVVAGPASAQFAPGPNPVTTTVSGQQTLSSGSGTVNSGGILTNAGGNATVLISGSCTTLANNGTIRQTGTGRAIDNTVNNSSLTITNTGVISTVSTDAIRVNTANTSISLTNSGTISVSNGGQAIDWAAIATAANSLNNQSTGVITAVGEDAVRPGVNGIVNNAGTISATPTGSTDPSGSDGIDLRTLSGIQVTNSGTISGRHGIATDGSNSGPSTLTVTNNAGGIITALNGSGINVDGVSVTVTATVINAVGAVIKGGVLATALAGDGDGIDVDGVLTLTNSGQVLGLGARGANNAEGVAAGGGTIVNTASGQIVGSSLLTDAPNGDATRAGNGILIDDSNGGNAVAVTSIANSGLIQGKTGTAIKIVGNFDDTITNEAGGTIRGAGTEAALQTGGGGDTVINRGAIISDIGNAIDLQAGDDTLTIKGGGASIVGNISGGSGNNLLVFDPGAGNTFDYAGAISMFGMVDVQSGLVSLSGTSTYSGTTRVSGGSLRLDSADRLLFGSALDLHGGMLETANAAGLNSQTFASLSLTDNSVIDLDQSFLTFNGLGSIVGGKSLTFLDSFNNASTYAFRLFGDFTNNAAFLSLLSGITIDGQAATFRFTDAYTYVSAVAPVPEPATLTLVGLGGSLLALRRRRAKQRAARNAR